MSDFNKAVIEKFVHLKDQANFLYHWGKLNNEVTVYIRDVQFDQLCSFMQHQVAHLD